MKQLSRSLAGRTDRLDEGQARLALLAVGLVALVALAGCSSLTGSAGPSVSDAHVEVTEENAPVMEFDYSVDEYSTVLLEGPDAEILNEKEVSPESNHSSIYMGEPREGEYKLVVQQGDETETTKSVTFDGPDAEVTEVEASWSGSTVESVVVTVENDGDLPAGVANGSYAARGQSVDNVPLNQWVEPNETTTLELSASYGSSVSVEEPGDVRGSVEIRTLNETLSGEFSKRFEGANLTIDKINDIWTGNTLEGVEVLVRNDGDLPAAANVSIDTESSLNSTSSKEIAAGETISYDLGGLFWNVDTVRTGGTAEFEIIADSESGYVAETFTHEIEPANVTVESMTPVWENGELTSVQFQAANNGELDAEFSTEVTVNGQTVDEASGLLDASSSKERTLSAGFGDAFYTVPEGGSYDVTLTLSGQSGWSTSATQTVEFDGPSGQITGLDTYFIDNYDSSTADLSSVSFDLQNTGDVVLDYNTIEIEMDGTTVTDSPISTTLEPGRSTYVSPSVDLTVSEGTQELTVRVLDGGETVAETTKTVSAGDGE